jgi:hypothetical protein
VIRTENPKTGEIEFSRDDLFSVDGDEWLAEREAEDRELGAPVG